MNTPSPKEPESGQTPKKTVNNFICEYIESVFEDKSEQERSEIHKAFNAKLLEEFIPLLLTLHEVLKNVHPDLKNMTASQFIDILNSAFQEGVLISPPEQSEEEQNVLHEAIQRILLDVSDTVEKVQRGQRRKKERRKEKRQRESDTNDGDETYPGQNMQEDMWE